MIDPELYTISVRKEANYDGFMYVGRVSEFPDICVIVDEEGVSSDEVRDIVIEAICVRVSLGDAPAPLVFPPPKKWTTRIRSTDDSDDAIITFPETVITSLGW